MTSLHGCRGRSLPLRTTHMLGLTSPGIQLCQCLLVRSEGRWVSLHLYCFFVRICNFYVFFRYISCFLDNRVLMGELCVSLQMLDLCGLPTLHRTSAVPDQRPQLPPPGE